MAEAQDSVQLVESLGFEVRVLEHSCAYSKFMRDRGLEEVADSSFGALAKRPAHHHQRA
jgi:hypothetical protein